MDGGDLLYYLLKRLDRLAKFRLSGALRQLSEEVSGFPDRLKRVNQLSERQPRKRLSYLPLVLVD